jgi:prepilin-type processing-associated H-X9-DG protein
MAPYYDSNYELMECPTFKGEWPAEKAVVYVFGFAGYRPPSEGRVAGLSYGYNGFGIASAFSTSWVGGLGLGEVVMPWQSPPPVKQSAVLKPVNMIAMADSMPQPGYPHLYAFLLSMSRDTSPSDERHNGGSNVAFADGHAENITNQELVEDTIANRSRWNRDNKPHEEISLSAP